MGLHQLIETLADTTEAVGVAIVVAGLLFGALRSLRVAAGGVPRYRRLRHDIGRAILLGLEVLVAADIVRTVAFTPTMNDVAVLALIVAIRTFLSWSLALELDGRWPWQQQRDAAAAPAHP